MYSGVDRFPKPDMRRNGDAAYVYNTALPAHFSLEKDKAFVHFRMFYFRDFLHIKVNHLRDSISDKTRTERSIHHIVYTFLKQKYLY